MTDIVYSHSQGTRRVSERTQLIRSNDSTVFLGGMRGRVFFEDDGALFFEDGAVLWDECSQPLVGRNLFSVAGQVDFNFDELTVDFSDSAKYPTDPIAIVQQLPHSRMDYSEIRPHLHWVQTANNIPNILIAYRVTNVGTTPGGWVLKALTSDDNELAYTEGGQQITSFNLPKTVGEQLGISGTFECKVYRDTTNASGLFASVDNYLGSWSVKYYDIHYRQNSIGSRAEFAK